MTRNLSTTTLVSSLALATALAAAPSPAAAQSLLGTPTVASGSATITEGTGTTDIALGAAQTVIDWVPDDNLVGNFGAIAFQNSGTTATYRSATDFAVLNRINVTDTSRLIFMNGTINSLVNGVTGGSVYFYSPSGFVIGSSAVINVGSLVLSASPIAVDGNGGFNIGGNVTFNQAPNPNALINTVAGSQINANGAGSYVAMIAPQVTHHGIIRTDTAAALVAAEAATITFSPSGLFTIQVTTGTDAATGIDIDGGTITRNSAVEGANHYAYLVSVAKNDAVAMLIRGGGSVGFETATSAAVENNVVVLAGGYNVNFGSAFVPSGTAPVGLTIDRAAFSSDVRATLSGGASVRSTSGATSFGGDLTLDATDDSQIEAAGGNPLSIAGNLTATVGSNLLSLTGKTLRVTAFQGATLSVGGNVFLNVDRFGASATGDGQTAGNATGGNVLVQAAGGGTVDITGSLDISANGFGGTNDFTNGTGGNGTGGLVQILANDGNSSVHVGGATFASADGFGGSPTECSICSIVGGVGTGGRVDVNGALGAGNSLSFDGDVTLTAAGFGGAGDVRGGNGTGGIATLAAADGTALTVLGNTGIDASGFGGFGFNATGGNGNGGEAYISTFGAAGSLVDLTGVALVSASGVGGQAFNGGTGTGGLAGVVARLGTIHARGDLEVVAHSDGGNTNFTAGNGGDGIADSGITDPTEAFLVSAAGSLIVDGLALVSASATGGTGAGGGSGGDAVAGLATINAANRDNGTSFIRLNGTVVVIADADGGAGGDGAPGNGGGNGGNGGSALAGRAVVTAAAGSGDLVAPLTILSASAIGGTGGLGGNGTVGAGGNGGQGGAATGGSINVGTASGNVDFAQGTNNGTAMYDSIIAFTTATGGNGGNGGFGATNGLGGGGGAAFGGENTLLVRGSLLTVGDVNLDASATGGDGGISPTAPTGDGGDATAGQVAVLVTNRFNLPLQRGTLNAGNIFGTAIATGGVGGLGNGLSLAIGGNLFAVLNSDVTAGNVSLVTTADAFDAGSPLATSSPIELLNGSVTLSGAFDFLTPGAVSMWADNGTFGAASISVIGDDFIHDDTLLAPASFGTFSADSINLITNGDLIVDAHLISTGALGLNAPGLIDIEDATSTTGDLIAGAGTTFDSGTLTAAGFVSVAAPGAVNVNLVDAGTNITLLSFLDSVTGNAMSAGGFIEIDSALGTATGDLTAGAEVRLTSAGSILTGNITSGDFLSVASSNGNIDVGDVLAVTMIDLDAAGDIVFGNATADDFDFGASGSVTGGDIIAGTNASGDAGGAVTLGNISVGILLSGGAAEQGFAVGIASETSISVGNVEADESIGFATLGSLTTGDLDAGADVLTMVGGDINIASITTPGTGRSYLADVSMFLNAGGPDNFDPALVFAATPVPTGGSIAITGPVSTGSFQAAAGTTFGSGAITAGSTIFIRSGAATTTGNLGAGTNVDIASSGGAITTGSINANTGILLSALNGITTGAMTSGGFIDARGGGSILTGDLITTSGDIFLLSGANITTGTVTAATDAEYDALGNVVLGTANVGGVLLVDAGGNFTAGAVTAGAINASVGGLASLTGMWRSPDVHLRSNDIDIAAAAGIDAGINGDITLLSTNATQALIGDGLTGTGYQLSNAEFGRLSAGSLAIAARGDASAAIDMLIGNLSITGPLAGSTIESPTGTLLFFTGDPATETPGGVIRVTGDVVATGFQPANVLEFVTGRFELDADTGSVLVEQSAGVLGGILDITAGRIHVASGAVLQRLIDNPQYAGRADDLAAPIAVARPDGVIAAGTIFVSPTEAVLVQNTGTSALRAGFRAGYAELFPPAGAPPGSIELIVNGQLVTEGGTLTGVDVRDALIDVLDIAVYTDNSSINGCPLTGSCTGSIFPPGFTPVPGIQQEITLINRDLLPPPSFGNEDFIDDNDEATEDGATSPIQPPLPLFDTSGLDEPAGGTNAIIGTPMRSSPGLEDKDDVDDPISGGGNPALMEAGGAGRPGDGSPPPAPPPAANQEKQP